MMSLVSNLVGPVTGLLDKVRDMIDAAEVRFENQRERVRVSQSGDMKELEEKLMDKLQRALDNPLAD